MRLLCLLYWEVGSLPIVPSRKPQYLGVLTDNFLSLNLALFFAENFTDNLHHRSFHRLLNLGEIINIYGLNDSLLFGVWFSYLIPNLDLVIPACL